MNDPVFQKYLPQRWREYLDTIGLRFTGALWTTPPQRSMTHRLDAVDEDGRTGYSIPLIRKQLLDQFDMSGSLVTGLLGAQGGRGGQNCPDELSIAIDRASNDAMTEHYLEADPRFYGTANIPIEIPSEAVKEIQRIKEGPMGARFVEVLMEPSTDYPLGNPKYWPVFEALEHYNMPLAVHVGGLHRRGTGTGQHNYYFEAHVNFALRNYSILPSMIFEGVFDRFPNLQDLPDRAVLGLGGAIRLAHGRDLQGHARTRCRTCSASRRTMCASNFYFHTQPLEEPEFAEDLEGRVRAVRRLRAGRPPDVLVGLPALGLRLSVRAAASSSPIETRRKILGGTASRSTASRCWPDSGITLQR